ncbi:MAG: ATP-binding cassette domain-containing protein, partial [Lentisphaerae bacterium]|nr:ATP-binding cassette domain-containing protein [Lentisphaerota bacterium]
MTETGIAIDGLRVAAGGRTILAVDRVRIAPDEVVGVIGPNGAGKSTLLKVCLGLVRIAAGRVRVLGQDVGSLGEGARNGLRGRIGYVPQ